MACHARTKNEGTIILNNLGNRKSIRMENYDYSQFGGYFVTICTHEKKCIFGSILGEKMHSNEYGSIVSEVWNSIPNHFDNVELDQFVVMPNHVHGIIFINKSIETRHAMPLRKFGKPIPSSLSTIVGSFKSAVSKSMHVHGYNDRKIWHRNYYEHIIRHEKELNEIRKYISNNPMQWAMDKENPYAL